MKKRAGLARALVMDPEIVLFDEPDSGLDPVRVSYLDELVERPGGDRRHLLHHHPQHPVGDAHGRLHRRPLPPRLVKFATKEEMGTSDDPIIRQFLAGRAKGPIGMDEMAPPSDARPTRLERRTCRRSSRSCSPTEELIRKSMRSPTAATRPAESAQMIPARSQFVRRGRPATCSPSPSRGSGRPSGRPALVAGVPRPVLVHRQGHQPPGDPHLHPVRDGHRPARRHVQPPARRRVATGAAMVLAIVREAAPVATALLIAGAGGSAMTADLGAAQIRDEIAAMEVMAVNPVHRLVDAPAVGGEHRRRCSSCRWCRVAGIAGGYFFNVIVQDVTPGRLLPGLHRARPAARPLVVAGQGAASSGSSPPWSPATRASTPRAGRRAWATPSTRPSSSPSSSSSSPTSS